MSGPARSGWLPPSNRSAAPGSTQASQLRAALPSVPASHLRLPRELGTAVAELRNVLFHLLDLLLLPLVLLHLQQQRASNAVESAQGMHHVDPRLLRPVLLHLQQ